MYVCALNLYSLLSLMCPALRLISCCVCAVRVCSFLIVWWTNDGNSGWIEKTSLKISWICVFIYLLNVHLSIRHQIPKVIIVRFHVFNFNLPICTRCRRCSSRQGYARLWRLSRRSYHGQLQSVQALLRCNLDNYKL